MEVGDEIPDQRKPERLVAGESSWGFLGGAKWIRPVPAARWKGVVPQLQAANY